MAKTLSAIPRPKKLRHDFQCILLHPSYTYTPIGRSLNKSFGKTPVRAVDPADETCQVTYARPPCFATIAPKHGDGQRYFHSSANVYLPRMTGCSWHTNGGYDLAPKTSIHHALPMCDDDCEPTYTRTPRRANVVSGRMPVSARAERHRRGNRYEFLGSCAPALGGNLPRSISQVGRSKLARDSVCGWV